MERAALKEAYATVLDDTEMYYVFDRVQAHYGFWQRLKVYGYRGGGSCSEYRILLSHHSTVGVMAHEVAHAIQYQHGHEKGKGWHTKKHLAITREVSELILSHLPEWRAAIRFEATEKQPPMTLTSRISEGTLVNPAIPQVASLHENSNVTTKSATTYFPGSFCTHCGTRFQEENSFCPSCGKRRDGA